ncbi:hypothetical protein ACTQ28_00720 [Bacillota bacterium LCP21S3_A4]
MAAIIGVLVAISIPIFSSHHSMRSPEKQRIWPMSASRMRRLCWKR